MIFTADKLKEARDAGYSDDEIFGFVSQIEPKFNVAKSEGYSLDEIAAHFSSQQAKPMVERVGDVLQGTAMDLEDAISVIGRIPQALAVGIPAQYQKLVTGLEVPKKNATIESDIAFQAQINKELEDRKASGELGMLGSATRQMVPSISTSVMSMGAAIPAGLVGSLATPLTGAATAGLASGAVSYRMQGADYLYRAFKQFEENKGSPLTDEEKAEAYKVLLPYAKDSALWEAGPEAVGNAVSLGVGKFVFGFGKEAATQLAKESGKAVEKHLARKIAEKSAAIVGGAGTEVGTEAITALGQYGQDMAAKQYAETGTIEGAPTEYPGGILQAAKDVAPATLATQALFMGAGGAVKLAGLPFEAKPKTPVQIATDNIDLQANKEATNLAINPNDEAGKGLSETINSIQSNLVNKKEIYSVLEPTDPVAQTLKLEIQDDENRLILMQSELNKRAGVELTEEEKQQIELAKAITAKPKTEEELRSRFDELKLKAEGTKQTEQTLPDGTKVVMPAVEGQLLSLEEGGEYRKLKQKFEPTPVAPVTPAAEVAPPTEPTVKESLTVAPEAPAAKELQIGDEITIMQVPSVLANTKKIAGVKWDIFNGAKLAEKRAAVRITDEESGEVLQIKQFKNYDEAETYFKTETDKAQKLEKPAPEAPAITPAPVAETPAVAPAAEVAKPTGGIDYYKQLGEQDALDSNRKKKRAVPQNFKLAYEVGWSNARKKLRAEPTPAVSETITPAAEPAGISTQAKEYATGEPNTPFYWENDSWKVDATRLPNGAEVLDSSDGPTVYVRNADGSVSTTGVTVNGRHENLGRIRNNFMPSQFANVPRDEAARALGVRVYETDRLADIFPALDQATAESLVAKYPSTSPAAEPTGISVGNRIKLGKSPQTYIVEEVVPQTEAEKANSEQFYSVKNERTGEVQVVEAKDLKKVVGKGARKMAAIQREESVTPTPEENRYTFEQVVRAADKYFGKMIPEGFVIVTDTTSKDLEYKAGYNPDTNQIILNLAYINNNESIDDLISHELGHYIFGDPKFKESFKEFWNLMSPKEKAAFDKIINQFYNKETGAVKMEEKQVRAFMQLIAESKAQPAWRKLLDKIKRWINEKLKTNFEVTDRGAAVVLAAAYKRFKSGEKIVREIDSGVLKMAAEDEQVKRASDIEKTADDSVKAIGGIIYDIYNRYKNQNKSFSEIAKELGSTPAQVEALYLKAEQAIKKGLNKNNIEPLAFTPKNPVMDWVGKNFKRFFTKEGNLPSSVYQSWVKRNGFISQEAQEVSYAIKDLYKGIREIFGINRFTMITKGLSSVPPDFVKSLNDALAGDIEVSTLPEQVQEPVARMRQHIDALSSELSTLNNLPKDLAAKITSNLGTYLTRSYKIFTDKNWINKIPQDKLTAARDFLFEQGKKSDPTFTIEQADTELSNMLNDWAGEAEGIRKRGGKLGAKDISALVSRKDIPKELRDVMGENTNVIFNYANTVSKIARYISDQKFLDKTKQQGLGKFLFESKDAPKGFNTQIAAEESRTMSPLNGLRTTPEIAKAFEEFGKGYDATSNPILKVIAYLNAVGKANLTIGSVLTQMRNLIGQPMFFLFNGHTDLRVINKEIKSIQSAQNLTREKAIRQLFKMGAAEGLLNENAFAGELRTAFEEVNLKTFEDMPADEFVDQFLLKRLFKKGVGAAQDLYSKTDEFGKLVGWLNETDRIQRMNPNMTRQEAMSIASERTRNTYPTYSQSSEALRLFRRQPFIGPFATFFYETFRTAYHNLRYAFEDINGPTNAHKTEGIKRLAGAMTQISLGAFAINIISKMISGISDKDEEDLRRMLPPWAKDASLLFLPKTKDGVYNFINFSYLNPYNSLTDPFIAMMSGFARKESPEAILTSALKSFLSPFTSEQPVTAAIMDASRNRTATGSKVYNEQDDVVTKTSKIMLHVFGKAFTPGTIARLTERIIPAIKGETVGTRSPAPVVEVAAELTGIRYENLDMKQAFQNKSWTFSKDANEAERIFRDVATRRRIVTQEDQVAAYKRSEDARYKVWNEMYRDYMAVRRSGATSREAVRLMTDVGISQTEASAISRGRYIPYEVSNEVIRRSKLNGNKVPTAEIRQISKSMPKVLEDLK